MIQLIIGILGLIACCVPSLQGPPLIWCAAWACGVLAGHGFLQVTEDRQGRKIWDELQKFQKSLGDDGPDRAG